MINYYKIPSMEYGLAAKLPDEVYETLYPLLEKGYGSRAPFFCYGSRSKYYSVYDCPPDSYGYPVDESDLDIAVPDNVIFENILMFEGWEKEGGKNYEEGDGCTISVWSKEIAGVRVQVSVRSKRYFWQMKHVWDDMSPVFYWKYLNKRSPHYMGKKEVGQFLNSQYDLVKWAPPDEEALADHNFVHDRAQAADWREKYYGDPLGYVSSYFPDHGYHSVTKIKRIVPSRLQDWEPINLEDIWGNEPVQAQRAEPVEEAPVRGAPPRMYGDNAIRAVLLGNRPIGIVEADQNQVVPEGWVPADGRVVHF